MPVLRPHRRSPLRSGPSISAPAPSSRLALAGLLLALPVAATAQDEAASGAQEDAGATPEPIPWVSPSLRFDAIDATRMVAAAADADFDGAISAEERAAFLSAHGAASVDEVLAVALTPFYDADQSGRLDAPDLAAALARWDADGDGAITAAERADGPRRRALRDGVLLNAFDADQDGSIGVEEWSASAALDLSSWLAATAAIEEDINGFGPGTMVLTLRTSLDVDTNGTFDGADLDLLFSNLDRDGDGIVQASEFAPPAPVRGPDWSVTDDMRARTPAMPWQRNLEDALALSQATGKPLLICVNTDGEAASDNLAFGRYRDPEFVALARGFVPLLASPNSHTDRAFDTQGERIECPRFGRLVCSEHIDEEPMYYERYFNGQRIAPRHVGVAPDGSILFDLVLLQDLTAVDEALREHGVFDVDLPDPATLDADHLLASSDAAARGRLAELFREADVEGRVRLIAKAISPTRAAQHPELLALGMFDVDPLVRSAAAIRQAAALDSATLDFAPRIRRLGVEDPTLRRALAARLGTLVDEGLEPSRLQRARRLGRIYRALEEPPFVDAARWQVALAGRSLTNGTDDAALVAGLDAALENLDRRRRQQGANAELDAMLGETTLRKALLAIRGVGGGNPQFFLQDAERFAESALTADPSNVFALATLARTRYWLNQPQEGADAAAEALIALGPNADARLTGELLEVLARGRTTSLYSKLGTEEGWPSEWVAQVTGAYHALAVHPALTQELALAGASLFENLEDYAGQAAYLRTVLLRFPGSADLHSWLRWQVLRDGEGDSVAATALADAYDALDVPEGYEATWAWYEGLAQSVAGDTLAQEGASEQATAAYLRSIESFERAGERNPDFVESAAKYIEAAHTAMDAL